MLGLFRAVELFKLSGVRRAVRCQDGRAGVRGSRVAVSVAAGVQGGGGADADGRSLSEFGM